MLAMLLATAFVGLGYRLVDLQVLRHVELAKESQKWTHLTYRLVPRRGDILDIKGNLLATSVFVKTVCADPSLIGTNTVEVAHAIAPLLQLNEAEVAQRIIPRYRTNEAGKLIASQRVLLKRKVSAEVWEKVRDAMARLAFVADEKALTKTARAYYQSLREKGIYTDPIDEQLRSYPNQRLASHVLGYMGTVQREQDGVIVDESIGLDGIERFFNTNLCGVRGWRVTERNRKNVEVVSFREQEVEARDGLSVVLTIDSVIQHIVESALAEAMERNSPVSASAIVIRPRTGEILAMATLPDFDPNNPGAPGTTDDARRNRVIADVAEPGSTFKIVVVSGALNDHIVKLTDEFDCEHGRFLFAGRMLHDHVALDTLTVENIITKSSNIGAAKIGIKMGKERLSDYIRDFGFGDRTGIQLKGEVWGIVKSHTNWTKVSIAQIPMGQGVAVTPLQMAMAMSAIANKGVLMRPMLVDHLVDEDGNVVARFSPQRVRRVIGEEADKDIIQALKTVTTGDGTAEGAKLEHYTVAGKTGTAQKVENARYVDKFYSSFIGFFPADNPEICIYVCLDDPKGGHYGGKVAAPVFKQIAEKAANYLNIRPDKDDSALPDSLAPGGAGQPMKTVAARSP
ncbi:MAG: spoVD 1 [Pedosphaera sp.]|nr:spoVD 1 [Pedosphaera sp.]